jgi:hypothetical protein
MVSYRGYEMGSVPLSEVTKGNKFIAPNNYLLGVARSLGIAFGD